MSDSKGSGPESGDDLWRDIARMEAEVADPEEGETKHYQREEMQEIIAKARRHRIPSKSRMKAVGGGALGLPRRSDAETSESPPESDDGRDGAGPDDQELPSVLDFHDDEEEDEDPTQVVPNEVAKVAAAERRAKVAAARQAFADKKKQAEAARDAELGAEGDGSESGSDAGAPLAAKEEDALVSSRRAPATSSWGWVVWFVVGCLLAIAFYWLRG